MPKAYTGFINFIRIVERSKKLKSILSSPEKTLENLLKHRVTPIPEKIFSIMRHLYKFGDTTFSALLLTSKTRSDVIASFVAILELLKVRRISVTPMDDDLVLHINKERKVHA